MTNAEYIEIVVAQANAEDEYEDQMREAEYRAEAYAESLLPSPYGPRR